MNKARKHLSAKGMLDAIYRQFKKINLPLEPVPRSNMFITLTDCLMSGLAVFGLKFPSLLKFDEHKTKKHIQHNLKTLYHVDRAPSDTYMRERCDEVDPKEIRKAFTAVFSHVQRGNLLKEFESPLLKNHYLIAGDGTGFFSSKNVHCENCCSKTYGKCKVHITNKPPGLLDKIKKNTYMLIENLQKTWDLYYINTQNELDKLELNLVPGLEEIILNKSKKTLSKNDKEQIENIITDYHRRDHPDEQVSYYHNMFCAAIVHPDKKMVLPLAPEPIMKSDGNSKNDCERNAAKRLYTDARREHPKMNFIVVEDSLASNVPHLTDLQALNMRFIVGAKSGDHKFLFEFVQKADCIDYSHQTKDETIHNYRYINEVQLNNSHDFKVNFIEYWEVDKKGKKQHFSWVTDIEITNDNAYEIMRGGRSNWRIENNTFNTLKNQDYHFSHNFGHGNKNLCTVFSMLMLLAFFVDQVQELSCFLFKQARAQFKSRTSLWDSIRSIFMYYFIIGWESLFQGIAHGHATPIFGIDTG